MTVVILRPMANGDLTQNTASPSDLPNWDCVNDEVANGDTDYVFCPILEAGWSDDLYILSSAGIPAGSTINKVTVYITVRNSISDYGNHYILIKTHETLYISSAYSPSTSYTTYSETYETNPFTGLAWTVSEIDNLQVGIRLETRYNRVVRAYIAGRCTQVYVEVEYTPPAEYVLTINVDKESGYVGETFTFTGNLTLNGSPVEGVIVKLFKNGVEVGSDVTASDGTYEISWIADEAGTYDFHSEASV